MVFKLWFGSPRPDNTDHIKPDSAVSKAMLGQVTSGCTADSQLFGPCHGRCRTPGLPCSTGFNLHEDNGLAMQCDQIQFPNRKVDVAMQQPVTLPAQVASGKCFAALAKPQVRRAKPGMTPDSSQATAPDGSQSLLHSSAHIADSFRSE